MRLLDMPPGRIVGVLLERLLDRVLDDPALNNPTDLERLLRELVASGLPAPDAPKQTKTGVN